MQLCRVPRWVLTSLHINSEEKGACYTGDEGPVSSSVPAIRHPAGGRPVPRVDDVNF